MLEIYDLYYKNKKCGEIHYNRQEDKFKAFLHSKVNNEFPVGLFTPKALPEVDDTRVKMYIKNRVAPKTRENIQDLLRAKGLKSYSPWGLYKANKGKNANDYATIKLQKVVNNTNAVRSRLAKPINRDNNLFSNDII